MQNDLEVGKDDSFGFGEFAKRLVTSGSGLWGGPRKGQHDDKAHPPIHPVKFARRGELQNTTEVKIYDLLIRHFLASVARDAVGEETKVEVSMGDELFTASGLRIL